MWKHWSDDGMANWAKSCGDNGGNWGETAGNWWNGKSWGEKGLWATLEGSSTHTCTHTHVHVETTQCVRAHTCA